MLETRRLSKTYGHGRSAVRALDDVTLHFERGAVYGIVGHNGAGKTTLIKLICGLVFPTDGDVLYDGVPLFPRNFGLLSSVGAILEGSRNIFWNFTPLQNIRYFAMLRGMSMKDALRRADPLFDEFGLSEKLDAPVRNLSQGMKQKIAIVVSMLHDPSLLLLDEPTLGLDPVSSRGMQSIIRRMAAEEGKTAVITSHQINVLENICDSIVFLEEGRVRTFDTVVNIRSRAVADRYRITVDGDVSGITLPAGSVIRTAGGQTIIETTAAGGDISPVFEHLHSRRVRIVGVDRRAPSLEEIFLSEMER